MPSDNCDGPPSPKRPRLTSSKSSQSGEEEEEEDEEDTFDPENFYSSAASKLVADPVHEFVQSSLKRCIPKRKRQELAKD